MSLSPPTTVHLLGLGAIGIILAMDLVREAHVEIIPLLRNRDRLRDFQENRGSRIVVRKLFKEDTPMYSHQISRSYCPETFPRDQRIQNLIVTTKTYQTKAALLPFLPYINKDTNILLIQNGLGVLEELRGDVFTDAMTRPNLFQGVIGHGAYQEADSVTNFAGYVDLKIARLPWTDNECEVIQTEETVKMDASLNPLVRALTEPRFAKEFNVMHMSYQELLIYQLSKFLVNSCVNPITAIIDCVNGELRAGCRKIFTSIVTESLEILKLAYVPLFEYKDKYNGKPGYPTIDVDSTLNLDHLVEHIVSIATGLNARNSSSMRQDTLNLRDTEINYINGYTVRLAERLGLEVGAAKTNKALCDLVELRLNLNRMREAENCTRNT